MASRNQSSSRGTNTSDKTADKAGEKQPFKVDAAPEKKDTTTSGTDKSSTDKTTTTSVTDKSSTDKTNTTTTPTTDKAGEKQPFKVDVATEKKDTTSGAGKSTDAKTASTTDDKKTQDKNTSTTKVDDVKPTDDKKTATTADKTVSTTTVDKAVVDKLSATVDKGTTDKTTQPFKTDVDANKSSTTTTAATTAPTVSTTATTSTPTTASTTAPSTTTTTSTTATTNTPTTATTTTPSTTSTTATTTPATTTGSDKSADKAGEKQPFKVDVTPEKKDDKPSTPADNKSSATPVVTKTETVPASTVAPVVVVAPKTDAGSAAAPKTETTTPESASKPDTTTPVVVLAPKTDSTTENKSAPTEEKKQNLFPLSQSDKSGRENQFRDAPTLAQSVHSGRNPQSHPEQTKPIAEKQVVEPTRPLTESAKPVTIDPLSPPQQPKAFHPAQEPFQPNKAQYPEKLTSVTIVETNPDSLLDEAFENLKEEVSTGKTTVPQRVEESVVITATETASTVKIEEVLRAPESTTSTGFAGAKPEDKKVDIKPSGARISTPKHIKTEANDMWTYLGIGVAALAVAGIGAWAYYTKRR